MKVYKTFQLNKILTKISNAKNPLKNTEKLQGNFNLNF